MAILIASAPVLFAGLESTLLLFIGGAVLATILSFAAGLCRVSEAPALRLLGAVYTELFRGVSLVVQLFWIYFVLPSLGVRISEVPAAILGLGLCFGAYGSEIVRSAILSVAPGQYQAASSLGLKGWQTMWLIVLPQALLIMIPPFGNLAIQLLKSTSVAALITVSDLTFQASAINNNYGGGWPIFAFVLLVYYTLSKAILASFLSLERRLNRHRAVA